MSRAVLNWKPWSAAWLKFQVTRVSLAFKMGSNRAKSKACSFSIFICLGIGSLFTMKKYKIESKQNQEKR